MISIRKADERGRANFGWLHSQHTFSFGSYYDPAQMGFSRLRVINDDAVAPGAGFDTHGHRDMEIISYVLEGSIAHKDSSGHEEILSAGEFQLMSAGTGILHSEFNPSNSRPLKFLQIWIEPNALGGKPGYQQKDFGRAPGLTLVVSPDGAEGSLVIKQDARLYQLWLGQGEEAGLELAPGRKAWVQLVEGELSVNGERLAPGDGAALSGEARLSFSAVQPVRALVFDLP
ncbi:pirin family protein [Zobellella denitrificans]|jgi:quercetin 2,3-dioxygenase|uniref:Pirin n=1 Tax=Zobellella denitrificans TaxID=347534 RepID=A0A231N0E4_9GAMM|nr:pirin family protein [Zobellella denitrificans]ATG72951.1 pirin [Zobellella denitrificans]OXS15725.1 pirin family protein [Zobellella denitrificans]